MRESWIKEFVNINSFTYILSIDRFNIVFQAIDKWNCHFLERVRSPNISMSHLQNRLFLLSVNCYQSAHRIFHRKNVNVYILVGFSLTRNTFCIDHGFSIISFWIYGHFATCSELEWKTSDGFTRVAVLFSLHMNKTTYNKYSQYAGWGVSDGIFLSFNSSSVGNIRKWII